MTPVGVFFICQNEDKCHFVNSTKLSHISAVIKRERRQSAAFLREDQFRR